MRAACKQRGIRFCSEQTPLVRNYLALPLFALPAILEERIVPFLDNVSPLRDLVERRPDFTCPTKVLLASLRRNLVLHESAHGLAAVVFPAGMGDAGASPRAFVMDNILAEALANAIEATCFVHVRSRNQLLALSLNSYLAFDGDVVTAMRSIRRRYGDGVLLRLTFAAFAWVNCGHRQLDEAALQLAADTAFDRAPANRVAATPIAQIFRFAARLNPAFLGQTTQAYFRMHGLRRRHLTYLPAGGVYANVVRDRLHEGGARLSHLLWPANG